MSENVLPMFFMIFMISYILFQSLSHFEFILLFGVYDMRIYSSVTDLHAVVQLTSHHLLKRLYFFLLYIFASCVKDQLTVSMWIFWALYSVPLINTFDPHIQLCQLLLLLFSCLVTSDSCDPTDCHLLDSSVHGISQATILEWVAISFSGWSSQLRDWICISYIGRWILYYWATKEALLCQDHSVWILGLFEKCHGWFDSTCVKSVDCFG